MYTIYHLNSAQDAKVDIIDAIKAAFKSKPITIIEEEDTDDFELSMAMKARLDERLKKDETTYLTAEESLNKLNKRN